MKNTRAVIEPLEDLESLYSDIHKQVAITYIYITG